MAEYIERRQLFNALADYWKIPLDWDGGIAQPCEDALAFIENAPEEDVAPVVHGRWIERKSFHAEGGMSAMCSVCRKDVQYLGNPLHYCPNCGARMDGEG